MRKFGLAWIVICIAIFGLALGGCSGEDGKDGLAGPPGADGTNGTDGEDGEDGTATCMQCHTDDGGEDPFLLAVETEFAESQHNTGDTYLRRGSTAGPECSGCHTNEGYQIYVATGTTQAVPTSSRIGCFTCHAPHTRGDFTLRKAGAVTLNQGGTYDKGSSNTCAMCHQARSPVPNFPSTDPITSSRWGPHHGTQGNVLAGVGAYAFPGVTYPNNATHNTGISSGCVGCHMGPIATDNLAGGHTYKVVYGTAPAERLNSKPCVACHTDWVAPADVSGMAEVVSTQAEFEVKLEEVKAILVARGWLNESTGLLIATTAAPLNLTLDERGAVWNWLLFEDDRSGSVHNPRYANAVMNATKAFLEGKSL